MQRVTSGENMFAIAGKTDCLNVDKFYLATQAKYATDSSPMSIEKTKTRKPFFQSVRLVSHFYDSVLYQIIPLKLSGGLLIFVK
jgi:hypothetical protein